MNSNILRKKGHEIIDTSDDEILKAVYKLLKTNDAEYISGASEEQYNKEIELAEKAIDGGSFITQANLENEAKKW